MSLQWQPTNFTKNKEDILGSGGFGVVYKCFDKNAHKFFVAKESISQRQEVHIYLLSRYYNKRKIFIETNRDYWCASRFVASIFLI